MSESPIPPDPASPPAEAPPAGETPKLYLLTAARERHGEVAALLGKARDAAALEDEELVHDLRVATRRLEEVLRLLKELFEKPAATAVGASLKSLRRAMGDLRDADVIRHHLAKARTPAPLKVVAKSLVAGLEQDRPRLATAAADACAAPSVQAALLLLTQLLEAKTMATDAAQTEDGLRTTLRKLLKKRDRKVRKAFGKAARKQTPQVLHAARIAIKKLRYAAELAHKAELYPHLKTEIQTLKSLQQLLGDHHDAHVLAETLHAHLHDPNLPHSKTPPAAAWRKWHVGLEKDQARRASEFFMKAYRWMNH